MRYFVGKMYDIRYFKNQRYAVIVIVLPIVFDILQNCSYDKPYFEATFILKGILLHFL